MKRTTILALLFGILLLPASIAAAPPAPAGGVFAVAVGMIQGAGPRGMMVATLHERLRLRFPSAQEGGPATIVLASRVSPGAIPHGSLLGLHLNGGVVENVFWLNGGPTATLTRLNRMAGNVMGTLASLGPRGIVLQVGSGQKMYPTSRATRYLRDQPASAAQLTSGRRIVVGYESWGEQRLLRFVRLLP